MGRDGVDVQKNQLLFSFIFFFFLLIYDSDNYGRVGNCLASVGLYGIKILSKPQINHNSTQPIITLSLVRRENDFAHHPTTHTQCQQYLNC